MQMRMRSVIEWCKKIWGTRPSANKQLRVAEVTQLGDKRLLAVIEVGAERFLIGASGSAVTLLTTLQPNGFAAELNKCGDRLQ